MSDIIFEDNDDLAEILLGNPDDFGEELRVSLKQTKSSHGDVRRKLEDLLQQKRLEEELDDEFSDDDY